MLKPKQTARRFYLFKIVVSILLLLLISSCGDESDPESRLRATIDAMEEAAEQRTTSGVMQHVSKQYKDHRGMIFDDIQKMVAVQLLRNQRISIFTFIRSINIQGDSAEVELSMAMSSRDVDLAIEQNRLKADLHRFSVLFELENDDWKVVSASWQRGWGE